MTTDSKIVPPIVTFWEGSLSRLLKACLRSQMAAGHRVTVHSFTPVADLPDGIENGDAETILPRAFAEKLRPINPDGSWPPRTAVQFSDFFRMRLMELKAGLWMDSDVVLLRPARITPHLPYFAYEYTKWDRPIRKLRGSLGNSALYLPPLSPIVRAYADLRETDDLYPTFTPLDFRLTHGLRRLKDKSARISDIRFTVYGPPAMTNLARRSGEIAQALPIKTFYTTHHHPERFFDPSDVQSVVDDPTIVGLHITPKYRQNEEPKPDSLHEWALKRFG